MGASYYGKEAKEGGVGRGKCCICFLSYHINVKQVDRWYSSSEVAWGYSLPGGWSPPWKVSEFGREKDEGEREKLYLARSTDPFGGRWNLKRILSKFRRDKGDAQVFSLTAQWGLLARFGERKYDKGAFGQLALIPVNISSRRHRRGWKKKIYPKGDL